MNKQIRKEFEQAFRKGSDLMPDALNDLLMRDSAGDYITDGTYTAFAYWQAAHARYAGSGGAVTAVVVSSNGIQWAGGETDLNVITRLGLAVGDRLELHPPAQPQVPDGEWDHEAYKSACDGLEYWKNRAEESEQAMQRMQDDLSPTYMGEPVVPELVPHGFTKAVRKLVFSARTSGGTAGRDDHLCSALDAVESLLPAAKEES